MKNRSILPVLFLFVFVFFSEAHSSEITWKLYLKPYMSQGPILSKTTQEGQEFIVEDYELSGSQSQYSEIVDNLEGTSFLIGQSPETKPVEIRIILNVSGEIFEKAGSVTTFLNATIDVYISGRRESLFLFSTGSPLIMTIPENSLRNLLMKCDLSRNDSIMIVYYEGGKFSREGVDTFIQTSGLKAHIDHSSTIIGGLGDDFGFPQNYQLSPWHKIKELFK